MRYGFGLFCSAILASAAVVAIAGEAPGVKIEKDRLARLKTAKMPKFQKPIPFDTPEADAVLSALEIGRAHV